MAFSLIEVLLSLALFAVALFALVAVSTASIKVSHKSSTLSAGALIANNVLQREVYKVLSDTPAGAKANLFSGNYDIPNSPWSQGKVTLGSDSYDYRFYSHTIEGATVGKRLLRCFVVVTWWSQDGRRAGYGKLEARASRLVNENERP